MLAFVVRREPEYDYAQAPHFEDATYPLDIPFSDLTDPPRDSDFALTPNIAGIAHPGAQARLNFYQSMGEYGAMGMMGLDDFVDIHVAHPTQLGIQADLPYGYQTPFNERFNNSGLQNPTTSYNTIIDKIVAGIKARRSR